MASICLIVPFFGKLPDYIPIVLRSCEHNSTIDWLIPSDSDWSGHHVPQNVRVMPASLQSIKDQAERALGTAVALARPYKLCDLKPMYGIVFADAIKDYEFWGHCDLDVIFGDLRAFLTADAVSNYPRLFASGHLSIYRNEPESNNLFRLTMPGLDYRKVLADPANHSFDETPGINRIMQHHNRPWYSRARICASVSPRFHDFRLYGEKTEAQARVFAWRRGKIYSEGWNAGVFRQVEYGYIHLQKRRMTLATPDMAQSCDHWLIVPNAFLVTGEEPLPEREMRRFNARSRGYELRTQVFRPVHYLRRLAMSRRLRRMYASQCSAGNPMEGATSE